MNKKNLVTWELHLCDIFKNIYLVGGGGGGEIAFIPI